MRRRVAFGLGALAATSAISATGQVYQSDEVIIIGSLPPLPGDLANMGQLPPASYTLTEPVGTARPIPHEVDLAYEILTSSPFGPGVAPIGVAQYFLDIGKGLHGEEKRPFVREWPVRANPVIYHMFAATTTKPEGDVTAWCAAFINWCILRSHARAFDEIGHSPGNFSRSGRRFSVENLRRFSTNHASSGSFRCWQETQSPAVGDIAVFKDPGTDDLSPVCRGTGHVAFVLERPGPRGNGWVRILGGNQSEPNSNGAVTEADRRTTSGSRFMKFVALKT